MNNIYKIKEPASTATQHVIGCSSSKNAPAQPSSEKQDEEKALPCNLPTANLRHGAEKMSTAHTVKEKENHVHITAYSPERMLCSGRNHLTIRNPLVPHQILPSRAASGDNSLSHGKENASSRRQGQRPGVLEDVLLR